MISLTIWCICGHYWTHDYHYERRLHQSFEGDLAGEVTLGRNSSHESQMMVRERAKGTGSRQGTTLRPK